jgi:hypothetical protein
LSRMGLVLRIRFTYNPCGELVASTLPYGGTLRWEYRSFMYPGDRTLREVQYRYLTKAPGASETTYTFYHDDGSTQLHAWGAMEDPSGPGRAWYFYTDGSGPLGALQRYEARPTIWASPILKREFAYTQDSAGRSYLSALTKTIEPDGANLQSKTEQTVDVHGNVTQSKLYDYGNLTTPIRTFNGTYLATSQYTSRHIWNRLLTSAVTDGTNNVTLVTNTYDGGSLTDIGWVGLILHDSTYGTTFHYRGNVTTTVSPGATRNATYDTAGNVLTADDGQSHNVSKTFSSATQYAAPDKITPGGSDDLSTNYSYSSFLGLSTIDTPDTSSGVNYDSYGRPTEVYTSNSSTTYAYDQYNVRLITATTGTRIVKTNLDGLGRTVKVETGDSTGTKLVVDTEYDSCACSPLGKVKRVSKPYKPGDPVYWTTYTFDPLGRTTVSVRPTPFLTSAPTWVTRAWLPRPPA